MKISVLNHFPVDSLDSGGQLRVHHFCKALARQHDVTLLALGDVMSGPSHRAVGERFEVVTIPQSVELAMLAAEQSRRFGLPVADAVLAQRLELLGPYAQAAELHIARSDLVVMSHPYLFGLIPEGFGGQLIYDAHNLEFELKAQMYDGKCDDLLDTVRSVEMACATRADIVFACSQDEAQGFRRVYGVPNESIAVIPNGGDFGPMEKDVLARRFSATGGRGRHRLRCLFMGSGHPPNNDAARFIGRIAQAVPGADFVVIGDCGKSLQGNVYPPNLLVLGRISNSQKAEWLSRSDIGLNPMLTGGGTNLKIFEFGMNGLLVVSTAIGVRGTGLIDGVHCTISEPQHLAGHLAEVIAMTHDRRIDIARAGTNYMIENYSWASIEGRILDAVGRLRMAG